MREMELRAQIKHSAEMVGDGEGRRVRERGLTQTENPTRNDALSRAVCRRSYLGKKCKDASLKKQLQPPPWTPRALRRKCTNGKKSFSSRCRANEKSLNKQFRTRGQNNIEELKCAIWLGRKRNA